ncbi:MAG: hypothetical protein HC921_08735 [Synechococcaceae cyanobacterium SM2_3_1]|nr:hypothetical protein [Synechococcaceae cyanobacterium SM2_3_1]
MRVSLEFLYHFQCEVCQRWWSQADIEPHVGEHYYCPYCGHRNQVEGIETFRTAARGSCLHQIPDSCTADVLPGQHP